MISMAKIEPDGTDYLFQHSTHEYMEEQTDEKGVFKGRLAKFQGLENKEVTKELFDKQMSHGKDFKGVEIDPSPCKDWSTLYNRVSPKEREEMSKIWNEAMDDVCKAIEQNTYYRETKDGKTEYKLAKGVCMAKFNHHTSRPVNGETDYQEHSHIVVFPKVLGQDNKFHSHTLMDLKYEKNNHETLRFIDSVMNHRLCKGLQEMGVAVSPSGDSFKIDCVQDDVSKNFSKRTNQINEKAGENATYAEKKKISLQVRERKSKNDLTSLRTEWQEKMDSMGFTESNIFKSEQKDLSKSLTEISKEKDKYVFSNKELKTLAKQQACFSSKSYEEILKEFQSDNKLTKISRNQNIFQSNHSMVKLAKELKSRSMTKSVAKKNTLKSAKPSKPNQSSSAKNSQVKATGSLHEPASRGESIQECLTDIKNLETEMSSLKLDDPKRARIESKIGDLKNKMKSLMKSTKEASLTSSKITEKPTETEKFTGKPGQKEEKTYSSKEDELEEKLETNKPHLSSGNLNSIAKDIIQRDIQENLDLVHQARQKMDISPSL